MRAVVMIFLVPVSYACAHNHVLSETPTAIEESHFTDAASGTEVTLERIDGASSVIFSPRMVDGLLQWYDPVLERNEQLPYSVIAHLEFKDGSRGTKNGFLIGLASGLLVAGTVFVSVGGACQGTTCSISSRLPVLFLAMPGPVIGALIGSKSALEHFTFTHRQP